MRTLEELNQGFVLGDWTVLPGRRVLSHGGEEIQPEPKVFDCLLALARRDGDLVTRDELVEEVWDGRYVSDEPIQRCISQLRGVFGDKRPYQYIETLHGRGYRLMQPVEDLPVDRSDPWLWKRIAVGVVIGFVAIAVALWAGIFTPPSEPPAVRSLAVLPIENLSGDASNQYIVDGIKNILVHRLAELPEFTIKNIKRDYDDELPDIAKQLNVESVLTGSMQLQNGTLNIVWHIERGDDGVTIGTGSVTGPLSGLFDLQERLATDVRNEIAGSETPLLLARSAPDSAAYHSFVRGLHALERRGEPGNLERAIELFEESIRLDPGFGPAYLELATVYALMPAHRGESLEEMHRLAIETVEQGIGADPGIKDAAGAIFGFVYHQQKRWQDSEAAYRRAVGARPVEANAFNWYSRMLSSVGRLEDSLEMILEAETIDPDNPVIASRTAIAYTYLGDPVPAHEYFGLADDLGATGRTHLQARALLLFRDGTPEPAIAALAEANRLGGRSADWLAPVFAGLADETQRDEALAALDAAWDAGTVDGAVSLVARTLLGDLDGAMAVAELLERPGEVFEMDLLYIPELRPLRQHPGFLPLLERLGVVAYWREAGCEFDGDAVRCSQR
jgi:DNA-binding winged helix-turn-helix (wHTH) protein/TolB-like protein